MPRAKSTSKTPTAKRKAKKFSAEQLAKVLKSISAECEEAKADPVQILKNAGIESPLVIVGNERVRVRRLINWFREHVFVDSGNGNSYFGAELTNSKSVAGIVQSLTSLSLFSKCELVVIYDADKVKAAVANPLVDTLLKGMPAGFLIMACEGLSTRTPLPNKLKDGGTLIEVKELSGNQLKRWVDKEARIAGAKSIMPDALALLIASYGNDLLALSQEISKLALLTADDGKITKEVVKQIALKTPERTSFELINQIAGKNAPNAIVLTQDLVDQGLHPLQLSAFFSRSIRTMLAHKSVSGRAIRPSGEVAAEISNAWFVRNLSKASARFSFEELVACLEVSKELDFQLKDSGLEHPVVLASAVQRMAGR